jgi:hypothetical protein
MNKFHIVTAVIFLAIGIFVGARYNVPVIGKGA